MVRLDRSGHAIPNVLSLRFGGAELSFDTGILEIWNAVGDASLSARGTRINPAAFHFLMARCFEHISHSQK
jgi:hypothetical protein